MSHDLRHHQDWIKDHPDSEGINNITLHGEDDMFQLMHYRCGCGWQVAHVDLTIKEARELKKRYLSTNTQARIFLEIE